MRVALAIAILLGIAACAPASTATGTPAPLTSVPSDVASPVTGVLTRIDATGLTQVTGFMLRLNDGREIGFRIGLLENGSVFPPGHLAEHFQALSPIRVFFHRDGDALVVYRLEDVIAPS